MIFIRRVFAAHLTIAITLLMLMLGYNAILYNLTILFFAAALVLLVGTYWYSSAVQGKYGLETTFLMATLLADCAGFYFYAMPPLAALLIAVTALGAWDLTYFLRRLKAAGKLDYENQLGRNHLRRLILAEALGMTAGMMAATIHISLPFWLLLLFIMLAVVGVSRLIIYVRKQAE